MESFENIFLSTVYVLAFNYEKYDQDRCSTARDHISFPRDRARENVGKTKGENHQTVTGRDGEIYCRDLERSFKI